MSQGKIGGRTLPSLIGGTGGRTGTRRVSCSAHRHMRCSEVPGGEPRNMPGPFFTAAQSGSLWKHGSFASVNV